MQESNTLARPYATAVFKLAKQGDKLELWSDMLNFAASVAADETMAILIDDPRVERSQVATLIIDVAGGRFNEHMQNLIRVMADNDRLMIIGEVAQQYQVLRAAEERREVVEVTAAFEVNPKFKKVISEAMAKRLGCEIELKTAIDKELIGGMVIRAGDLVIDASLKGRIKQLTSSLV